jgi:hypothetical protein
MVSLMFGGICKGRFANNPCEGGGKSVKESKMWRKLHKIASKPTVETLVISSKTPDIFMIFFLASATNIFQETAFDLPLLFIEKASFKILLYVIQIN